MSLSPDEADFGSGLRVLMLVSGFPASDRPSRGIFNLRAAQSLGKFVNLTVLHLRAWKPTRYHFQRSNFHGIRVITVCVPQASFASLNFNLAMYRFLGWPIVRNVLKTCDLIHSVEGAFAGVLGSGWGRWVGVPNITQFIGSDILLLPQIVKSRAGRGWKKNLWGVACNSSPLAEEFIRLHPEVPNVRVIYRGVDLACYHPVGPATGPLADRPPVRFAFLGGFPPYLGLPYGADTKGGATLLKAWQEAEPFLISANASLLIAGSHTNISSVVRWRSALREPNRVYIVGLLDPETIPGYLRSSDVVLVPSMREGLPNVAMEASACGRPVFGSDVGGIPEVVKDQVTGLILPAGDVQSWRNALVSYASQLPQLRLMGDRARERMELLFDSKQYATQMLDLYRASLHSHKQKR